MQLERDLPRLLEGDASDYHAYAFATARMAGSAFEVACLPGRVAAGRQRQRGVAGAGADRRGLQGPLLQARTPPAFEPESALSALGLAWDEAMEQLDVALA